MAALVAVLVVVVAGGAWFGPRTMWFTLMAEVWKKPAQPARRLAGRASRRVAQMPAGVREAHEHASRHRAEVLRSGRCGCFYCCSTFPPQDITRWTDEVGGEGQTALCPRCGIDSVLGDRSGFDLSPGFLQNMKSFWF
jgi:hypothetical protein